MPIIYYDNHSRTRPDRLEVKFEKEAKLKKEGARYLTTHHLSCSDIGIL